PPGPATVSALSCRMFLAGEVLSSTDEGALLMKSGPEAKVADSHQNVRASERYDLEIKVDLESEHNFYTGLTQNISAGGLFIATHHLRRIGDRITLKF